MQFPRFPLWFQGKVMKSILFLIRLLLALRIFCRGKIWSVWPKTQHLAAGYWWLLHYSGRKSGILVKQTCENKYQLLRRKQGHDITLAEDNESVLIGVWKPAMECLWQSQRPFGQQRTDIIGIPQSTPHGFPKIENSGNCSCFWLAMNNIIAGEKVGICFRIFLSTAKIS